MHTLYMYRHCRRIYDVLQILLLVVELWKKCGAERRKHENCGAEGGGRNLSHFDNEILQFDATVWAFIGGFITSDGLAYSGLLL